MENAQKTLEQRVQELHLVHRQAGTVLEYDQRWQCLEHRLARLQSLTQLNQRISSSLHLHEVLHAIAQAAATLMQVPVASFWLANEATQTLEFHACSNERAGADWPLAELSFAQGGAGWVATHQAILNVPNIFADARIAAHHWFRAHGFQSALLIPIVLDDALLTVLTIVRAEPFHLDADDQTMPHMTGEVLTLALRHIRPDIPIILCTGFSHVMTIEKAGLLGVDAFLMKPLVIHDLGLAIQRVLASRRSML